MRTSLKKNVVRFKMWYHPIMAERFADEADFELKTCELVGADAAAWSALGEAHAYQISSAKDEIPRRWFADVDLLARCPKLLCVSTNGAGSDTVDLAACTAAGVLAVNQAGANAQSVAEHTIGAMLDLSRRLTESDRLLRRERGFSREDIMGREITGKVLGLVGIGHIGSKVARMGAAFGMTVLATDPYLTSGEVAERGARSVALDELLERSDFVSLHCPRNAETLNMLDASTFGRMKRGAIFITTARGGIHDEAALVAALETGHLAGAGVDVWDVEPPPLEHPLLAMNNVLATYHTAGVTPEARATMGRFAADQIIDLLRGGRPPRLLNPEALPLYRKRFEAIVGDRPSIYEPVADGGRTGNVHRGRRFERSVIMQHVIEPSPETLLAVKGDIRRFPVRRIWCVGRNYTDHAREMGHDADREPPFFFAKPANAAVPGGAAAFSWADLRPAP